MSRSLAIIPIVHTEADLGNLADHLRAQIGDEAWADKQRAVAAIWQRIAAWCTNAEARGLRLFQDGLPDAPSAAQIVRDLAGQGSLNHRILQDLIDRGAVLVGTEDPGLILREYEIAKAAAEAVEAGRRPDPRDAMRSATLLDRRDEYIARKIDESLGEQAAGVLFIGMLHNVAPKLPASISVSYPLGQPAAEQRTASTDAHSPTRTIPSVEPAP
jgi:hypothetical protein